jgi:UDP-GlcNAc:undecaprenyl-phosphate/decaprenyl-phosphate GlcNAc-1-phosphate transferase
MPWTAVWPGGLAFLLVVLLTPVVKRVARQSGAVAVPKADRWHRTSIPLMGGVAIVLAVVVSVIVGQPSSMPVWVLLACATGLSVVGFVDDVRVLKPQTKLFLQIFAAGVMTVVGLQFQFTGVIVLDMLITLVWLVGITNALNLLDNMDGLAAGIAAIVAAFRLLFFIADGSAEGVLLSSVLLGACLGFLVFNFNPASIFMGDTGSLFLGFMVAGLSLVGGWPYARGTTLVLVLPVLVVLVPIFDTTFVTVARILAGRPVSQGGRDHTSHRLVALGMSERQAVLTLYLLATAGGAIAWLSYRYGLSYGAVLAILLALATILLGIFLGRLRVYPEGDAPSGAALLLTEFTYRRQVVTVAVDTVLIVVAYYTAYLLRFEGAFPAEQGAFARSLPIVLLAQVLAFLVLGTHRGIWRYTGLWDLIRLAQACAMGTVLSVLGILFLYRFQGFSRAVFVIHGVLLFLMVAATRISFRALDSALRRDSPDAEPVLVYGAGKGGLLVARELRDNTAIGWRVVGFLDDDRTKQGTRVDGVLVHGGAAMLEAALRATGATRVILSTNKLADFAIRDIVDRCTRLDVEVVGSRVRFDPIKE